MGEVQGMWRNTAREKVSIEDERENLQKLCEISHAIWQRNVVSEGKRDVDLEKNGKSDGKGYVWCEAEGAGKFRRTCGWTDWD